MSHLTTSEGIAGNDAGIARVLRDGTGEPGGTRGRTLMSGTGGIVETSAAARTDAGMLALWNPARFAHITSYPAWECALLDEHDIARHVQAGDLVPVNIGADGAFGFTVRAGPSGAVALTGREHQHLRASSQRYLYRSAGVACLSGIEDISADPGTAVTTLAVPAGRCAVTIHLIDWAAEPGAIDQHGRATPSALPDFVILICPPADDKHYRAELQTFDRPDG